MKSRFCIGCGAPITGRADKKFCKESCKSAYHYMRSIEKEDSLFKNIDKQLKANRRILKDFNKAGKATVRKEVLIGEGFNPKYFTHYWKAKNGNVYIFCYDFGYMKKTENGKPACRQGRDKYVLVQWQEYMN